METAVLKRMRGRIIKDFMDVLILSELRKRPMSGYNVIEFIHNKFGLLVSSGTVYSLLYSLEREKLIEGMWNERKRVYRLTEKGEKTIRAILNGNEQIQGFMTSLLK